MSIAQDPQPHAETSAGTSSSPAPSSSCIPDELLRGGSNPATNTNHSAVAAGVAAPASLTSSSSTSSSTDKPTSSVFSRSETAPVHNVPMRVIHRPLPSELNEDKVATFMQEMEAGDTFTPIEVVKVRAPLKTDPTRTMQTFYFSMGGCHRYEATKRLGWETIRARIIEVPASQMRVYLGAGSPF